MKKIYISKIIIARLIVLIMVVLMPLCPYLLTNSERKITLNAPDLSAPCNLRDSEVQQEIIVQGSVKKFGIFLSTPQLSNTNSDEKIKLTIRQGQREEGTQFSCVDIVDGQINYINGIDWSWLKAGFADVTISAQDLSEDVYVYLCADGKSGFHGAIINGTEKQAPMCMEYEVIVSSFVTACSLTMFAVLGVLLLVGTIMIESDWKYAWEACCAISFLAIVITICIRQPAAAYLGEPRSEAAYEFWQQAEQDGLFGSILNLECGLYYLSFIQRIVAWLAVKLSPNVKYVFIIMQMMQTFFIAFCSCMVWSRKLFVHPSKMNRMLVSILIGCDMGILYAYYFHCMGYWGMLFIVLFSLFDMEKVNKYIFVIAVLFASICCLSKMAYIVAIPSVICFVAGKNQKLTRRDICWILAILIGCVIQVAYTFSHTTVFDAGIGLGTIQLPSIRKLIDGLFYYGVQGLNTFLFNFAHSNAWYANCVLMSILLATIGVFLYRLFYKRNRNVMVFGLLGVMFFSVLGFTMLTSAGGFDMLSSIDWSENRLLNHQHFAYVKFLLCLMCLVLLEEYILDKQKQNIFMTAFLILITFSNTPVNSKGDYAATSNMAEFPTEWQRVAYVTKNDSYYMPINEGYPFALISMTHNSYGILIGYDKDGQWTRLPMAVSYPVELKYSEGVIGDAFDMDNNGILSISTRRSNIYIDTTYEIVVYDRGGKVLQRKQQCNSSSRYWIDFMFDEPIYNAYRVEFIDTLTGGKGYVSDALNIGIDTLSRSNVLNENAREEVLKKMSLLEYSISDIGQSEISVEYCNNNLILGTDNVSIHEGDDITMKGWAVDCRTSLPYSDVYAVIDDIMIEGKMGLQREDVAIAYENETVLASGFVIDLPEELLKNAHTFTLIFTDDNYFETRVLNLKYIN